MENDLLIQRRQLSETINNKSKEKLNLKQNFILKKFPNLNINEITSSNDSTSRTLLSLKNSSLIFKFLNKHELKTQKDQIHLLTDNRQNARRDNFGNEIKKGGKQKIAFADDIKIVQSLMKNDTINSSKNGRKGKCSSQSFEEEELPKIGTIGRSLTFKSTHSSMMKNIYNLTKNNKKDKNILEEHLVDVIKVECTKNENKLNTYSIKERINNEEEQEVCCSCYCSIF